MPVSTHIGDEGTPFMALAKQIEDRTASATAGPKITIED
jgi:hypothetical protein